MMNLQRAQICVSRLITLLRDAGALRIASSAEHAVRSLQPGMIAGIITTSVSCNFEH